MPARGTLTTLQRSRPRDQRRLLATFEALEWDGVKRGFPLPVGVLLDGEDWHPMTVQWWETWRVSAQAMKMVDTDWQELLATAILHHEMWAHGRTGAASELRQRVSRFGATVSDRVTLRMNLIQPGDTDDDGIDSPDVTDIASRRSRLSG
jgi:hypothetical protein